MAELCAQTASVAAGVGGWPSWCAFWPAAPEGPLAGGALLVAPPTGWLPLGPLVVVAAWVALRRLRAWRGARGRRRRAALLFGPVAETGIGAGRGAGRHPGRWRSRVSSLERRHLVAGAAGLALLALLGGLLGAVSGALTAVGVWRLLGERDEAERRRRATLRQASEQLPFAAELLAACIAAGSRPLEAARAVGTGLGGPLGERLVHACQELHLGAEPGPAWERVAEIPGGHRLARCLERAQQSGAPAVEEISRQAAEARADQTRVSTARARRATVLVTGPLGLCFLPAFLLATVVPVVIALGLTLG